MNLTLLIEDVAKRTGLSKADVGKVVRATLDAVAHRVSKGEEVRLTNFGTFTLRKQPNRLLRNPRTGETRKENFQYPGFRASGKFRTVIRSRKVVKSVAKSPKGAAK